MRWDKRESSGLGWDERGRWVGIGYEGEVGWDGIRGEAVGWDGIRGEVVGKDGIRGEVVG